MKVDEALEEIDDAIRERIGTEDESFRESVESALEEVESLVGGDGVDDLARSVGSHIREHESRPAPKQVREEATTIVNEKGQEVPEESYLAQSKM
ncbi:MAG: hypothetical protein ABEH90_11225 [Halolamina sp.]